VGGEQDPANLGGVAVGDATTRGDDSLDRSGGGREAWDTIRDVLRPRFDALYEAHRFGWTIVAPTVMEPGERPRPARAHHVQEP